MGSTRVEQTKICLKYLFLVWNARKHGGTKLINQISAFFILSNRLYGDICNFFASSVICRNIRICWTVHLFFRMPFWCLCSSFSTSLRSIELYIIDVMDVNLLKHFDEAISPSFWKGSMRLSVPLSMASTLNMALQSWNDWNPEKNIIWILNLWNLRRNVTNALCFLIFGVLFKLFYVSRFNIKIFARL